MGIHDREYYRDEPTGGGFLGGMSVACKRLIAINVVVYILQVLTAGGRDGGGVTSWRNRRAQSAV